MSNERSGLTCGCDPGCNHMCERHAAEQDGYNRALREMAARDQGAVNESKPPAAVQNESMAEAWRLTHSDRRDAYGPAEEVFRGYGLAWTAVLSRKLLPGAIVEATDVTLMMAALKILREAANRKSDNVVDAHGYLILHDEILNRE